MAARFHVTGGVPLHGTVRPAGNKNAALHMIAAALMADDPCDLTNVPRIRDVEAQLDLARGLGADVSWSGPNALRIDTRELTPGLLHPRICASLSPSILF